MMEKYTQPSAYFPDLDQGSCLLAATSPGGLLLVILILIRLAKSWRGNVGVPCGIRERRKGMIAGGEVLALKTGGMGLAVCPQSLRRNHSSAVLRLEEGGMRNW